MKLTFAWIPFLISLCTVVPLRIYFAISQNNWDTSIIFGIIVAVFLGATSLSVIFAESDIKIFRPTQNFTLGITALISAVALFWNGICYLTDTSAYDTDQNPVLMSALAVLSAITFAMQAFGFFTEKNLFRKVQVMILLPSAWCAFSMIAFLSISNSDISPYNILQKSLMLLFLLYQSQIFVTFSNRGVAKRLFAFGLPFILSSAMFNIPNIINLLKDGFDLKYTSASESIVGICLAVYTVFLLLDCVHQSNIPDEEQYDPFPDIESSENS